MMIKMEDKIGGLCDLKGTDKQVAWATDIRETALRYMAQYTKFGKYTPEAQEAILRQINLHPEARFWIDHRGGTDAGYKLIYGAMLQAITIDTANLPALEGTDKQIAWATRIREDFVRRFTIKRESAQYKLAQAEQADEGRRERRLRSAQLRLADVMKETPDDAFFAEHTKAAWWIDHIGVTLVMHLVDNGMLRDVADRDVDYINYLLGGEKNEENH